jgi:predicted metal-dependent hydrolase
VRSPGAKIEEGSCNAQLGTIRINTKLVKKPRDILEYVIVHELTHLIEANHSKAFFQHLDRFYELVRRSFGTE